jgi:hypothetical protein
MPEDQTINEGLVAFTAAGHFVWVHPFSKDRPGSPVRMEPLPTTLSDALCLGDTGHRHCS